MDGVHYWKQWSKRSARESGRSWSGWPSRDHRSQRSAAKQLRQMNGRDPAWLQGETRSPCEALVWREVDERQFCVLPFYENDDRNEKPHYAMYGRALSDGRFYPIRPTMYYLTLAECGAEPDGSVVYKWEARTHGHLPYSIPVHMQRVRSVEAGRDARGDVLRELEVTGPIAPEFVSPEDPEQPHGKELTVFYPDARLWWQDPFGPHMAGLRPPEIPVRASPNFAEDQIAPVQAHFCTIFKQICVRSSSTTLWDRTAAPF